MTLQEAHAIQCRELMSLRAENKRLLKQASALFPSEEKETLERRIRHLENIIKTNDRKYKESGYRKLCDYFTIHLLYPFILLSLAER